MTNELSYIVDGMTCSSCTLSVTEEINELPGIQSVNADLASGAVTVRGENMDDSAIRAAIQLAGYEARSTDA